MINRSPRIALVTGASGFLGGYVVRAFLRASWRVIGVDALRCDDSLQLSPNYMFLQMRLPSRDLAACLRAERPDVLIHAAGPASVQRSLAEPMRDYAGSVGVTNAVLDAVAMGAPQCHVVYLSSAAVYGNPERLPVREVDAVRPISPYGLHRLACETLLTRYRKERRLACCSARIFSAYGAGLRKQLLWDICRKAMDGDEVSLHGTGMETRDFIHADDVAGGILQMVKRATFDSEVYNLASGSEISIAVMAERLLRALGRDNRVNFIGKGRDGDPMRWSADISRLQGLGYAGGMSLDAGLKQYAKWFLKLEMEERV